MRPSLKLFITVLKHICVSTFLTFAMVVSVYHMILISGDACCNKRDEHSTRTAVGCLSLSVKAVFVFPDIPTSTLSAIFVLSTCRHRHT